ncbi:chaplin [Streptomyces sp. NPDC090025]|uniref:chaplin n=1 Tax=Streptomyces sp. NPDC090025 TaxID=3365922 RepID=UPI00383989A3
MRTAIAAAALAAAAVLGATGSAAAAPSVPSDIEIGPLPLPIHIPIRICQGGVPVVGTVCINP